MGSWKIFKGGKRKDIIEYNQNIIKTKTSLSSSSSFFCVWEQLNMPKENEIDSISYYIILRFIKN